MIIAAGFIALAMVVIAIATIITIAMTPNYVPPIPHIPVIRACNYMEMEPGTPLTEASATQAFEEASLKYHPLLFSERDFKLSSSYYAVSKFAEFSPDMYFTNASVLQVWRGLLVDEPLHMSVNSKGVSLSFSLPAQQYIFDRLPR